MVPNRQSIILLFVRWPEPGKVKTRLAASVGADEACAIYVRLANRAFSEAKRVPSARVIVCGTGARSDAFRHRLPGALAYWDQPSGDLGERLRTLFQRAFALGAPSVLALGSDAPGLDADAIKGAAEALLQHDACLLPADDGGYVLIGLRQFSPVLFEAMPWSTPHLLEVTRECCTEAGLSLYVGATFGDVDTHEDWQRLSHQLA